MKRQAVAAVVAVLSVAVLHAGKAGPMLVASERVLVSTPEHRTSEFAAAQDPTDAAHLVVAAIDWDTSRGTWTCAAFVSFDAGRSWTSSLIVPDDGFRLQGDPWVAFGPDGTVHYTCLSLGFKDPNGANQLYARSTDGGRTWSAPVSIAPRAPSHHVDRNGIVVHGETVVSCVNEYEYPAGDPNPYAAPVFDGLAVARSTNSGVTWSPTTQLFTTYAGCRDAAVGPDGNIYLSFAGTSPSGTQIGVVRSDDDGVTWTAPMWVQAIPGDDIDSPYYGGIITVSQRTGSLFVSEPGAKPRLFRSTDNGETYQVLALPDIPTTCVTCDSVNRTLVTSTAGGDIGVEVQIGDLNAVRSNAMYPASITTEEWLLVSRDDGATWLPPVKVAASDVTSSYLSARTLAPNPAMPAAAVGQFQRDPSNVDGAFWPSGGQAERADHLINGGDYIDLTTSGDAFQVMWVGHYNGLPQIWTSTVSDDYPSPISPSAATL